MFQLTKDQIQLIDDYLKKNKVKYWDVRMELLDHVASAIEKEVENGRSFDEALKAVHLSFGNKPTSKKLNKENTHYIITESIYADNSGYLKLIAHKQKELQKGIFAKLKKELVVFFKEPLTLLLYGGVMASLVWLLNAEVERREFYFKTVYILLVCLASAPVIIGVLSFSKTFKTLYLNSLMSFPILTMSLMNVLVYFPKAFWIGSDKGLSPLYITLLFAVLFPLMVAEFRLYLIEFKRFRRLKNRFA